MSQFSSTREPLSEFLPLKSMDTNHSHMFFSLSSILTCRFILNLRQVEHSGMFSTMSSGEDVQFATQDSGSTLPRSITSFGELIHTSFSGTKVEESNEAGDAGEDSGITHGSSSMQDTVQISV